MLLQKIERFLAAYDMPWTRFGRLVANDPRLIGDMRIGRIPRPELTEKIERFMRDYDGE